MQKRLIECVPNFSDGRNLDIINQITDAIELYFQKFQGQGYQLVRPQ